MASSTTNNSSAPPGPPVHLNRDPREPYRTTSAESGGDAISPSQRRAVSGNAPSARSFSKSPVRAPLRVASNPAQTAGSHALSSVRSNPVLSPSSRQPGRVRNIASRFDQTAAAVSAGTGAPPLSVQSTQERYRKVQAERSARSPASSREPSMTKLQKRRPGQPKSPTKFSPATSFETNNSSFTSNGSVMSANGMPPSSATRASPTKAPYANTRPLFGELTADGWHGNFDLQSPTQLPVFQRTPRRQSDGSIALGHGRSQSHQDMSTRGALSPPRLLQHKRSRSEMDNFPPSAAPNMMPNLNAQHIPALYPTPPNSGTRKAVRKDSPTSRIPVSSRRMSEESGGTPSAPYPRSASATSSPRERRRLSKSPTRIKQAATKENVTPLALPRSRYQPQSSPSPGSGQTLSAKIVAPLPKLSPPLRSSRPRQSVSSATTSASRARAAERSQHSPGSVTKDGRRPSEQWLGKPYDPQRERTKRRIPELGKADFAERRARIQQAISQNLESQGSKENLRADAASRRTSQVGVNEVDEQQAREMEEEPANPEQAHVRGLDARARGLSIDTAVAPGHMDAGEPKTAATQGTEFEVEESPVLGRPSQDEEVSAVTQPLQHAVAQEEPVLLSAVAYQAPSTRPDTPPQVEIAQEVQEPEVQSPSVVETLRRMRDHSESSTSRHGTDFADDSQMGDDSPSDIVDRWGLGQSLNGDQGSIRIMLEGVSSNQPWLHREAQVFGGATDESSHGVLPSERSNGPASAHNGFSESPTDEHAPLDESLEAKPRKPRNDTLKPAKPPTVAFTATSEAVESDSAIAHALDQYQATGQVAPEMLEYIQDHSVDLQRLSANGGSDAHMVQNLLDSFVALRLAQRVATPVGDGVLPPTLYEMPAVTPDTPPGAAMGTAVVYGHHEMHDALAAGNHQQVDDEEDDFQEKIRKADEAWERQQRGEDVDLGASQDDERPSPPPKDFGYTPRSSTGPASATLAPNLIEGLRISTGPDLVTDVMAAGENVKGTPVTERLGAPGASCAPPRPAHAPPPVPSANASPVMVNKAPWSEATSLYIERGSNELSPKARRHLQGPSGSARPSVDSQRPSGPPSLPGAQSMSSMVDSSRQSHVDGSAAESATTVLKTQSPGPEQKRLQKRRNVIKELIDTENSYHQDLKIIEDIYKATVGDLVTTEDRRTLFGNCDEIERFSLHFYDELRKSAQPTYIPAKQMRWASKRGSYSTTQSDGTGQTSMTNDSIDDKKDRDTTIGRCFLNNIQQMDHFYGAYLKNHDAANQRLTALKATPTVKCWLDECHNNASDITSAWDLDSLLVKPTQRVAKYPLMLQQLLECTPKDHPDYENLQLAAKDSVAMLTRINEAKKRADLVDQIINRKGKESTDMRSGIAKAFGRRTEKLKERVGIAEAWQDAEFDELSHKFGGHFIRLQICMRDVQDYVSRVDKAMEQITHTAAALDLYTDVSPSSLPEIEAKWRRYGQTIREIAAVTFPEHKAAVHRRVIQPMITCIKLHEGPQNAIAKRKKRIVDYARCKSIEKRGEKPDRKTVEASEMYMALNEQLKIDLPKLYRLTGELVQATLVCFLEIQCTWYNMWERKLRPLLEEDEVPEGIDGIEPAFRPDYEIVKGRIMELGLCNGALLFESANYLAQTPSSTTMVGSTGESSEASTRRPSTIDGAASKRTHSMTSEGKRYSNGYAYAGYGFDGQAGLGDARGRSNSSLSTRAMGTPGSAVSLSRPWSNVPTPNSGFAANGSRPATANPPQQQPAGAYAPGRPSLDPARSPRPASAQLQPQSQTYFSPRTPQEPTPQLPPPDRFSGLFSSALPPDTAGSSESSRPLTPMARTTDDTPVLFVCASLFEFSIDKTRKEAGYPYLTYVQGEVFDVVAQKGELWLARNQDDAEGALGWIWEQHFVILSQEG